MSGGRYLVIGGDRRYQRPLRSWGELSSLRFQKLLREKEGSSGWRIPGVTVIYIPHLRVCDDSIYSTCTDSTACTGTKTERDPTKEKHDPTVLLSSMESPFICHPNSKLRTD